ncbi:CAP domain-containing protein [Roseibium sp. RKSG952]|uniref:CAP domain-containing protein n=1 Tax=Roseibium sp. RKSG952 TaxID=2529384 RepID=UPI0018AD1910|nr:CAP domain-containing protein [Roseibium sp. RKSG952]
MSEPSAYETYMLELINRARADPDAEAALYGIDLNEGLAPGTIDSDAKEPLAFSTDLNASAEGHSQSMLDDNYFSHTGSDGSSASERIFDAGWTSATGGWATGENIALSASTSPEVGFNIETIEEQHEGLFLSEGHRTNILSDDFSEVGISQQVGGYTSGGFTYSNTSMITQNYAEGGRTFLTGVVIDDTDSDDFYDIGEGLGAVTITATGASGTYTTTTWDSGAYSLEVEDGSYTVTFSGGDLDGTITKQVTVDGENVKVDGFADEAASTSPAPDTDTDTDTGDDDEEAPEDTSGTGTSESDEEPVTDPDVVADTGVSDDVEDTDEDTGDTADAGTGSDADTGDTDPDTVTDTGDDETDVADDSADETPVEDTDDDVADTSEDDTDTGMGDDGEDVVIVDPAPEPDEDHGVCGGFGGRDWEPGQIITETFAILDDFASDIGGRFGHRLSNILDRLEDSFERVSDNNRLLDRFEDRIEDGPIFSRLLDHQEEANVLADGQTFGRGDHTSDATFDEIADYGSFSNEQSAMSDDAHWFS